MCCDKNSDIHKTKLTVNMFIILGYVNNFGKNRNLQKILAHRYTYKLFKNMKSAYTYKLLQNKSERKLLTS